MSSHQRRFAVAQYDWGSTHWAYVRLKEGWYFTESSYACSMQSAENVVLTMYLGDGVMEEGGREEGGGRKEGRAQTKEGWKTEDGRAEKKDGRTKAKSRRR